MDVLVVWGFIDMKVLILVVMGTSPMPLIEHLKFIPFNVFKFMNIRGSRLLGAKCIFHLAAARSASCRLRCRLVRVCVTSVAPFPCPPACVGPRRPDDRASSSRPAPVHGVDLVRVHRSRFRYQVTNPLLSICFSLLDR